jgi:hypothetical protein
MIERLLGRTEDDAVYDPAEPWEGPGDEADLRAYTARRLASYAHRPRSPQDVPVGALEALTDVLGHLAGDDLVILPRTPRVVGGRGMWVVTPASVLGVGDRAMALWVDGRGAGVVAVIAFDEIAAIVDRTILLLGRLEVIGAGRSIVVRYNTVGRHLVRNALAEARRSFWPPAVPPTAAGVRPEQLPHKWKALLHSSDILPHGPDGLLVAAGALGDPRAPRNGVAALSSTELLIATEPTLAGESGHYGVDLVVLPRPRLRALTTAQSMVIATVDVAGQPVQVPIEVSPSLAVAVEATLVPAVAVPAVAAG